MLKAVSLSVRAEMSSSPLLLVVSRVHSSSYTLSSEDKKLSGQSVGTSERLEMDSSGTERL